MIYINSHLIQANKELKEIIKRMSCPTFDYNRFDQRAQLEYHALIAQCEKILAMDKDNT